MKIYVDFDDVLCETARYFSQSAKDLFGIDLPYSQIQFFDLQESFCLNEDQYREMMRVGHLPENLMSLKETDGASQTLNHWADEGHEVFIITGRPFSAYDPSRKWLDEHHLKRIPLFCVDKYGREGKNQGNSYNLTLEQFYQMTFDFAVEDSPAAFGHLLHFAHCSVAIFDRPWNRRATFPDDRFERCSDWKAVERMFEEMGK